MSASPQSDIPDLTGTWVLNRELSTDPDEVFALQGVTWLVRKVLQHARLTLELCQTTSIPCTNGISTENCSNENGLPPKVISPVTSLQIKQTVNPGGFDTQGSYVVDGSSQHLSLPIFGDIRTQLKFIQVSEIVEDSIRERFEATSSDEKVIQELAHNASKRWDAEVIWALEVIEEKRYLTRNVSTTKENKKVLATMIYDCAK